MHPFAQQDFIYSLKNTQKGHFIKRGKKGSSTLWASCVHISDCDCTSHISVLCFLISDDFFEVQSSSSSTTVIFSVSLAVCILVVLIIGFFVWRQKKTSKSQVNYIYLSMSVYTSFMWKVMSFVLLSCYYLSFEQHIHIPLVTLLINGSLSTFNKISQTATSLFFVT